MNGVHERPEGYCWGRLRGVHNTCTKRPRPGKLTCHSHLSMESAARKLQAEVGKAPLPALDEKQRKAIDLVERLLRQVGAKHVIVQLTGDGVELEDTSWAGSSYGETLVEAIEDAMRTSNA